MMTIFKFEVKKNIGSTLLWIIGIFAFMITMMAFYPIIAQEQELMDMILAYYPPELLRAFGLSNVQSLATIEGYLPLIFVFLQLILAIHASVSGFSALTLEESDRTADFLLTKPVNRTQIYGSKVSAALFGLGFISLASVLAITTSIMLFAPDEPANQSVMNMLYVSIPLFQGVFFSIGLFVSMMLKRVRSVLGLAMGLSFFTYGSYAIKETIDSDWIGNITPFHYFDAAIIVQRGTLDAFYVVLSLLIIIVSVTSSFVLYKKRNIALY